jgi:hypothetical protein
VQERGEGAGCSWSTVSRFDRHLSERNSAFAREVLAFLDEAAPVAARG